MENKFLAPAQADALKVLAQYDNAVERHADHARAASTAYLDCRGHQLGELTDFAKQCKARVEALEAEYPWVRAARNAVVDGYMDGRKEQLAALKGGA